MCGRICRNLHTAQVPTTGAVVRMQVMGPGLLMVHQLLASVTLLRAVLSARHLAACRGEESLAVPFAQQARLPVLVPCATDRYAFERWCHCTIQYTARTYNNNLPTGTAAWWR